MDEKRLTDEDKKGCVFLACYEKKGRDQWIRIGMPDIDTEVTGDDIPERYKEPQIEEVTGTERRQVKIRVYDEKAIDLTRDDLLGDYFDAARRCDESLRANYGAVILDNLSRW